MDTTANILVVDREEAWIEGAYQEILRTNALRLGLRLDSMQFGKNEGDDFGKILGYSIVRKHHFAICRPLCRLALPDRPPTRRQRSGYRADRAVAACMNYPLVWVALAEDRQHPQWEDFLGWAVVKRHCILDADADWTACGGSCWQAAVFAGTYLYLRNELFKFRRRFAWFSEYNDPRISARSAVWPVEQDKLMARVAKIMRRDSALLKHDTAAATLVELCLAEE